MTKHSLLFKLISLVVIVILLFTMIGTLLGLNTNNLSFTRLLEGFSNSPVATAFNDFGNRLNSFKNTIDSLRIDSYTSSKSINTLINLVNSTSAAFFGMISISITAFQMFSSVLVFAYYCWTTFFV